MINSTEIMKEVEKLLLDLALKFPGLPLALIFIDDNNDVFLSHNTCPACLRRAYDRLYNDGEPEHQLDRHLTVQ